MLGLQVGRWRSEADPAGCGARSRHASLLWQSLMLAGMLAVLIAWGISSPVGSSPDDDFHLASIWCGHGLRAGLCEASESPTTRLVPEGTKSVSKCIVENRGEAEACFSIAQDELVNTDRGNFNGHVYPGLFYWLHSYLVSNNVEDSVIRIRILNAFIYTLVLATLMRLLPTEIKSTLFWAIAVTFTPLVAFFVPSTNPSSWAIIAGTFLLPTLVSLFYSNISGPKRIVLSLVALILVTLGAGARADSAIYCCIAAIAAFSFGLGQYRRRWWIYAAVCLITAVSAFFYLTAGQAAAVTSGFGNKVDTVPLIQLLFGNLTELPSLWAGALGYSWGLGWLDTAMPAFVQLSAVGLYSVVVFFGARKMHFGKAISSALIFACLIALPMRVLLLSGVFVGEAVQPRYLLPLIIMLAFALCLGNRTVSLGLSLYQVWLVCSVLGLSLVLSLHANLQRYVQGSSVRSLNLNRSIVWWWETGPSPMLILFFAAVGAAMIFVGFGCWASSGRQPCRDKNRLNRG